MFATDTIVWLVGRCPVTENCRLGWAIAKPDTNCVACWVSWPQPNLRKINYL